MHVEYKIHRYPYYVCMKVFCPYQAVQIEITHMKNCSLIPARLDDVGHAWHVVPTFLTFDDPHDSVYFDWRVIKVYNVI